MEELIDKVEHLLERAFRGATTELEVVRPGGKIGGFLIWSGFGGIEQIDRQRELARVLHEKLRADDLSRVTTILTMTPEESAAMKESASAE